MEGNFIIRMKSGSVWVTKHEDMEHTIYALFSRSPE
jgi:hypothetical protein